MALWWHEGLCTAVTPNAPDSIFLSSLRWVKELHAHYEWERKVRFHRKSAVLKTCEAVTWFPAKVEMHCLQF